MTKPTGVLAMALMLFNPRISLASFESGVAPGDPRLVGAIEKQLAQK